MGTRKHRKKTSGRRSQRRLFELEIHQPFRLFVPLERYVRRETNARTNIPRKKKSYLKPERQQKRQTIRNFLTPSSEPSYVIRLMYLIIGRCVGLLMELNNLYVKDVLKLGIRKKIV